MSALLRRAGQVPYLTATLVVLAGAGVLAGVRPALVPWVLGVFALGMALRSAVSMVRELRSGAFGVDVLAVTAVCATVAVHEYWAATVVVLMLTGGEALELYAAGRARRDLTALITHAPHVAHVVAADGAVRDVPLDDVEPGETLMVRANEVVPADGTLLSELGVFDESSLTGESVPEERVAGDEVLSGGVNGAGAVELLVTRRPRDSQYQQIVALVAEAAASRAPMVRLADRYAVPFTAVALLLAGGAWWWSGDAIRFAEVLVVATPCPLIIAAPVAFMAGMSRSARLGAIVKSSAVLERFHRARSVAFDKTGTLTHGRPALAGVQVAGALPADEVLRLAASAEQASSHTLAAAVVSGAQARGLRLAAPRGTKETVAGGVSARVGQHHVVVGKAGYVAEATGAPIAPADLAAGEIAIHVAVDGGYAGFLVLRDELRADAAETVHALRDHGIRHVAMLTGDDRPTAEHVAAQLDIDSVFANCLPGDKVRAVKALADRPVIMVGDGVNDAPVLAAADVGIAMGARGSTAASESADVVILRDDLAPVARALEVGRRTVDVALQAIWIGIGLSVALMVVAVTGVVPPIVGAWFQEGVDVVAILWALRAAGGRASRAAAPVPSGRTSIRPTAPIR